MFLRVFEQILLYTLIAAKVILLPIVKLRVEDSLQVATNVAQEGPLNSPLAQLMS